MPQLAERDDFLRVGPAWAPVLPTFACLATADFEAAGWADRARFAGAFVVGDVGGDVWLLAFFAGAFVAVVVVLARALSQDDRPATAPLQASGSPHPWWTTPASSRCAGCGARPTGRRCPHRTSARYPRGPPVPSRASRR